MPYCRNKASFHSCDPSCVLLTVDGATNSHTSVLYPRCRQIVSVEDSTLESAVQSSLSPCDFCLLITMQSSLRSCACSTDQKSARTHWDATGCTVTLNDDIYFP